MNKRLFVVVLLILVLGMLVVLMFRRKSGSNAERPPAIASSGTASSVGPAPENTSPTAGATSQNPPPPPGETKESWEKRIAQVGEAIESSNVPIAFWGKVVDENNVPIEGVHVGYSYTTEHISSPGVAWSASREHDEKTQSNNQGLFSVSGVRGSYFTVKSLEKEGYIPANVFPSNGRTYNYNGKTSTGAFTPNQAEPVVFVLIRKGEVEPLTHFSAKVDLLGDGTPMRLSLQNGQKTDRGELQLRLQRTPAQVIAGQPFKWEISVQVVGGGVQFITEASSYIAPETGYEANGLTWTFDRKRAFFLRTSSAKFARVDVTIYADDVGSSGRCYVEGYVNPSGSRNLEYDPAQKQGLYKSRIPPSMPNASLPSP